MIFLSLLLAVSPFPYSLATQQFPTMIIFLFLAIASSNIPLSTMAAAASTANTTLSALLAFKASISVDPTGFLAAWNTAASSSDYCTWPGIHCLKGTQNVTALLLDSNQLNGTLTPQLGDIPNLSYLNVSNNSFHGPIPPKLGKLSSLTHLDLHQNYLTGGIPNSLANLTQLQYLDLSTNSLSTMFPSFLPTFTPLTYLDLSSNLIIGGLPSDIGLLSNLQFLQLYASGLNGSIPTSITNCTSLVLLGLTENELSGPLPFDWSNLAANLEQLRVEDNSLNGSIPSTLGNCTMLTSLRLEMNSFTGEIPESLGRLTLLQSLFLYLNGISGAIPTSIMNCTKLIYLQLDRNNLSGSFPQEIGQLNQVRWLSFKGNSKLGGTLPDTIGGCTQLQHLVIEYTGVWGSLPSSLFNLSNLQGLWLTSSRFSGRLSEQVKMLTPLLYLHLGSNAFEGQIPAGLGELKSLQGVYLDDNKFTGPIPPQLSGCTSISEIDLSYNSLSGTIPTALGQLKKTLNSLYLQNNRLSREIPDIFGSLIGLENLNLAHNMLTGPIPNSLANLGTISMSLDLSFNRLTGTIPSSVGDMQMVMRMSLAGNQFTGEIPGSFEYCQGLQVLDLSMNKLQGEIPSSLGQMKSLQYLNLSQNKLSGALPSSLGYLPDLVSLNASYNELQGMIPDVGIYKNSSSASFLGNPGLCGYPLSTSCNSHSNHDSIKRIATIKVYACVIGGGIFVCIICACSWRWCCDRSRKASSHEDQSVSEEFDPEQPQFKAWTARQIRAATEDFDAKNVIGSGGVSVCYKGMMDLEGARGNTRALVAVKRLSVGYEYAGIQARRSFVNELKTLCKMRHRNLVKVLGYCVDGGEVALVMEFMEGGNLDERLHSETKSLCWEERVNVAAAVAEGLVYIHHEYVQPIVHCDLKPKNILLGSGMLAKISDFGIATILERNQSSAGLSTSDFRGTLGYAAPEYAGGSGISKKVDVYSYGVLLMELVTGLRPTSPQLRDQGISLQTWARTLHESGKTKVALDKAIRRDVEMDPKILHEAEELLDMGIRCSTYLAKERPNMKVVRNFVNRLRMHRMQGLSDLKFV